VLTRASQLNGCAYCLDIHMRLLPGHTQQGRARERAALAWCETVTRLDPVHGVPDEVHEEARALFSEEGLMDLAMVVIVINGWNRIAVPSQADVGGYKPARH